MSRATLKSRKQENKKTRISSIETKRHSLSHVLAQAVKNLYPKVKLGIGPAIENGFYYDFDNLKLAPEDLPKIQKEMQKIINQGQKFEKFEMSKAEAKKMLKSEPYKLDLLKELKEKPSFYKNLDTNGNKTFVDMCSGPHIESTKELAADSFKLNRLAGAYWRGDEKNKMLTRIYGIAMENKSELKKYLEMLVEAEKRDHRKIGAQQDLFSFHEEGPGFPFWHAKGWIIWNEIVKYWREVHRREGYTEVNTPIILSRTLWEKSGHWEHYKENMYFTKIDEMDYAIKPMNCPGGVLVYKNSLHSYKEFPLKVAELGLVHRHELSGVLHGLFRVRSLTQDDAHIYCLPDQIEEEVGRVIDLIQEIYKVFGFKKVKIELSTRPDNRMGSDKIWDKAELALKKILQGKKVKYQLNEGDGAFYGPKIDFHITDSLDRTWQCGTIQLDFAMPETLDIEYVDEQGKKKRPVMLHRTVLGSFERFIGILIEHYAGAFPLWLSPVQITIIPVGADHKNFSHKLADEFRKNDLRVEVEDTNETVGNKIRKAEKMKIPYMLVIGDKEMQSEDLNVRLRGEKAVKKMSKEKFVERMREEVEQKK
ncbi:threonine--tRNA ligase [Patescibacteria group bacterium]|nr:threonine--tRNA ligase [Patescibacteria group bacterium]MBU4512875.1 threonine--tRNA ligase [Patescibacteria group bacterium]MCG2693152.1 threonine--tRNA ligase [Candidatus Parcubacteria bacterium]